MSGTYRANTRLTIQASAASTDASSMWYQNQGARGGVFQFNVTAASATGILPTFTVQGRVGDTTKAFNVGQVVSTSTSSVVTLVVYPGASTAQIRPPSAGGSSGAHDVWSAPLPYYFRVKSTNAGSGTVTWAAWVDLIN